MEQQQRKKSLFTLLFTVFLDLIGVGIIIPILPLVFFTTDILPAETSYATRTLLIGLLIALFPFSQFFGAPLLGVLSDVYGRKKILLLSLVGTAFGYVLFALGLFYQNIALLFISRIIDGFTGGNLSIVRSGIADVSSEEAKVRNFGLMGMVFGLSFIIGPFIGGKLTDHTLVSWFNPTTPFWFAAFLSIINIVLVLLFFKETLQDRIIKKMSLFIGFEHLRKSWHTKPLRLFFLSFFLINFGWSFFTQFFPVFLFERFNYTPVNIGNYFAFLGLCIAFAHGVVIRPFSRWYKPAEVLRFSLLFTAMTLLLLLVPKEHFWLYIINFFLAIFYGFTFPNFSALFSNTADKQSQGEIMGIQQSLLSLSYALPPLLAGMSLTFHITLPIFFASFFMLIGWIVFVMGYNKGENT